tara:strand:- start:3824 stop:4075 length:252 start_codon:yes stop_codon:yes gene_type:complete
MSKSIDSLTAIEKAFEALPTNDRQQMWDTYGFAFASMDKGRILLREIIAIASSYGIKEEVVRLRRLQWLDMKKGPLADLADEY